MFDYNQAFSRNLGWTTEWEQAALRAKRVAIAGLGGVGGAHLLTLTRLGIGSFSIADFDTFDIVNFNRQAGANLASLGRPKVDVVAEMALAINPELRIARFPAGVDSANLDEFLTDADLFVDGLDFFALPIRARVFARCAELGIPAITAAPIGMGTGFLAFLPGGQTFEQYFRLENHSESEQYLRFLLGVAPAGLHRRYLADDTRVDLAGRRGPSTAAACELCAGIVATQALKILLSRGGVPAAPVHLTMDAYRGRATRTRLRWGNAGPLQRLKLVIARRAFASMAARAPAPLQDGLPTTTLGSILDAARWAPSGDNTQPWRFEPLDDQTVRIHLTAADPANPYEYRGGEPILLAGGMLLESLRIAATAHGRALTWSVTGAGPSLAGPWLAGPWLIEARFPAQPGLQPSPLLAALPMRSVGRKRLGTRPLTAADKTALHDAIGPTLQLTWFEQPRQRLAMARLGARATAIRLRVQEAFAVHRSVVDWSLTRSPHGLPAQAIGLNKPTLRMMRWAMNDWRRMHRLNSTMGTAGAALQLDIVPGLASAAFFSLRAEPTVPGQDRAERLLRDGEQIQRFWLTATRRGLALQPALATLIFADHGATDAPFTADPRLRAAAVRLAADVTGLLGPVSGLRFLGRVGRRPDGMPGPRSIRRSVQDLTLSAAPAQPTPPPTSG